jgi:hypothetical protein
LPVAVVEPVVPVFEVPVFVDAVLLPVPVVAEPVVAVLELPVFDEVVALLVPDVDVLCV